MRLDKMYFKLSAKERDINIAKDISERELLNIFHFLLTRIDGERNTEQDNNTDIFPLINLVWELKYYASRRL